MPLRALPPLAAEIRAPSGGGGRRARRDADSHIHSPTRKGPGAKHSGKEGTRPQCPLVGWRSGSGECGLPAPTASGLGPIGRWGRPGSRHEVLNNTPGESSFSLRKPTKAGVSMKKRPPERERPQDKPASQLQMVPHPHGGGP